MIGGRKKKEEPIRGRNPHIVRQKQSAFQYSSNRSPSERTTREQPLDENGQKLGSLIRLRLAAFKLIHGIAVLGFFAIIILLSLLVTKPHADFKDQQLIRGQEVYDEALADIADDTVMNHSKITINRTEIATKLQDKFPELQDIDVATPLFSPRIVVKAKVSQPVISLVANQKNYLLDNRGVALMTTTTDDNLLTIEDQTGAPIEVGKPALTSSQMSFIEEVKRQSEAKQMTIEQVFLVAGGGELDVRYAGTGYLTKYNLYEDARKSFGTFYATQEHLQLMKTPPVEYIDVRVPERAYVK